MKLEQFLIREAIAANDWGAAICAIERHFRISFPDSAFNEKHRTVYRHPDGEPEINVIYDNRRYSWSSLEGFTLHNSIRVSPDFVHVRIFIN